jgi:fibro-slime domain-containing protein
MKLALSLVLALAFGCAACGSDGNHGNGADDDDDSMGDDDDSGGPNNGGDDSDRCGTLHAVIRDFKISHPDFEVVPDRDEVVAGLVNATITPGGKPSLSATAPVAGKITSAATFAEWYTDVAGVNYHLEQDFVLDEVSPGKFVYDKPQYFPIDGQGFGNEKNSPSDPDHNYHFTTELHATFPYKGGEKFTFRGDDDVWVYVNGKLVIDIGGIHNANERTIDFDARAAELGLTVGQDYPIDFFQAERHVVGSSFRIETTIACFIIF